ncbi:MAG: major capsid protein [Armatimonadetes bacterium]|nr:major capsid protein [Armatimonadota bacterium]MDW8122436.1 major capsid protein [Armatimonadota bacterium]
MPVSDPRDLIVDTLLTQVAIAYRPEGFIGTQILKPVPVKMDSGKVAKFGKDAFRLDNFARGPGSRAFRVDWSLTPLSYSCTEYAVEIAVDDQLVRNAQSPVDPFTAATQILVDMLTLDQERRILTAITSDPSVPSSSPSVKWNQPNSAPLSDLRAAIQAVQRNIGRRPTTVAMSRQVWEVLLDHPQITDRVKYTTRDITADVIARLLDLREVLIGDADRNTAPEGRPDDLQFIWGDTVVVAFVPESPGLNVPAFGYCFTSVPLTTERYRDEPSSSSVVRVRHATAEVLTAPDAGYLLTDVLA